MPEFVDGLFVLKAIMSSGIVVALSLIAERLGPRAAGLLTGLPLGAGMVVIFTGVEQGGAFAAEAAGHMVPGFVTTVVFVYFYAVVALRGGKGGVPAVFLPLLCAHAGYAIAAWLVAQIVWPMWLAIPMVIAALYFSTVLMRAIPNKAIVNRVRFGGGVMAFRAGMATIVILIITGIAGNVGPQWTGILTAYPLTLLPVILVLHITYAGGEIAAMLKHVPNGLGGVISFCLAVHFIVPIVGMLVGVGVAFGVAFLVLFGLSKLGRKKGVSD